MPSFWQRVTGRSLTGSEQRSLWARTDGDLLRNDPTQLVWLGPDNLAGLLARNAPAEALPVTTRATSLITGPLTASPYQLVDDASGEVLPTPRWLGDPMLLRPDARLVDGLAAFPHARRLTRSGFFKEVIRSCVWHGQGAFVYQVGSDGSPVAGTLRQVNPSALSISDRSHWILGTGADRVEFDREGWLDLGGVSYRIAVMRNPLSPIHEDGLARGVFGLSPSAFEVAATVDSYITGTFTSGVPAGLLKVSDPAFNQEKSNDLKARWMAAHGGDRRSVAVLSNLVDFQPLSFSPVDAEAVSIARQTIGQVAFAFGLPPEVLGVSLANSSTYVNVGDTWDRLKAFGLSLWISELEDLLSSLVPYGRSVRLDLSEFEAETTPTEAPRGRLAARPAPPAQPAIAPAPEPAEEEEVA